MTNSEFHQLEEYYLIGNANTIIQLLKNFRSFQGFVPITYIVGVFDVVYQHVSWHVNLSLKQNCNEIYW